MGHHYISLKKMPESLREYNRTVSFPTFSLGSLYYRGMPTGKHVQSTAVSLLQSCRVVV